MKRLHDLFERYFEEAKNLKNAYKSLPDDLAIEMQKDLTAFYKREILLLNIEIEREFQTSKYYENYKSEKMIPRNIKKRWFKRIFRKEKTDPNTPATEIINRVDDEIRMQPISMLTEPPEKMAEKDLFTKNKMLENPDEKSLHTAVYENDVATSETAEPRQQPERNDKPRLVEVQTDIGAQIQIQFPPEQEKKNAD